MHNKLLYNTSFPAILSTDNLAVNYISFRERLSNKLHNNNNWQIFSRNFYKNK